MEDNKPIDGAEYISLEDAKRLKLPYFEGLAAGYPSPAGWKIQSELTPRANVSLTPENFLILTP